MSLPSARPGAGGCFLSLEEAAMKKHWILVSALLAASGASQAHQIWLEQPAG
jgi:hypothetical protein